jgi:phenylpropionate dioxygenase-like ring-hydroxylating dioxygenase large terminal subunit
MSKTQKIGTGDYIMAKLLGYRFTQKDMTDMVIETVVETVNVRRGFFLDPKEWAIRPIHDPLDHDIGRVAAEFRCLYEVYHIEGTVKKLFRCYLKPNRMTYTTEYHEDFIHFNNRNTDDDFDVYHMHFLMDSRIFPREQGASVVGCPVFLEQTDDIKGITLESGYNIMLEEGNNPIMPEL